MYAINSHYGIVAQLMIVIVNTSMPAFTWWTSIMDFLFPQYCCHRNISSSTKSLNVTVDPECPDCQPCYEKWHEEVDKTVRIAGAVGLVFSFTQVTHLQSLLYCSIYTLYLLCYRLLVLL